MEGGDIGAGEALDRGRRAAQQMAVGGAREHGHGGGVAGQVARLLQIDLQRIQGAGAQALQLVLGEHRPQGHVGEQGHGLVELGRHRMQVDAGAVPRGAGLELGPQGFEAFGDLLGRTAAGPLVQQGGGEIGQARLARRIGGAAALDGQLGGDQGQGPGVGDDHPQAVGQGLFHRRGQDGGDRCGDRRNLLAFALGSQGEDRAAESR